MATVTLDRREAERSDLPRVCMYCGRRASQGVRRRFRWYPRWAMAPLLRIIMTKYMYVSMPVCVSHAGWKLWNGPSLWGLRPVEITDVSITLAGVSEDFADALFDYRRDLDPEDLDDEEFRERRQRRINAEEKRRPGGPGPGTVMLLVVSTLVLVPFLICGGVMTIAALSPHPPYTGPTFPPLPPIGQAAPREARSDEIGLLAIAPDAGGLGALPWPALAFSLRKEPLHLLTDAELDKTLAELASKEHFKAVGAAENLAAAYPTEHRRQEVASALVVATASKDTFVHDHAVKALAVWATRDNVPALINLLADRDPMCRGEAYDALAALKDERGAAAVAPHLANFQDRDHARKALEAMGPIAEKAVLAQLGNREYQARLDACNVLKVIGTTQSVEELQNVVLRDKEHRVVQAAKEALQAIAARP